MVLRYAAGELCSGAGLRRAAADVEIIVEIGVGQVGVAGDSPIGDSPFGGEGAETGLLVRYEGGDACLGGEARLHCLLEEDKARLRGGCNMVGQAAHQREPVVAGPETVSDLGGDDAAALEGARGGIHFGEDVGLAACGSLQAEAGESDEGLLHREWGDIKGMQAGLQAGREAKATELGVGPA